MLSEAQIYAEASAIIQIAMGREKVRRGSAWRANQDPLACVMAVEAVVSLVQRANTTTLQAIPENGSARIEGYKHILHASDGHKNVVVDDSEEHPFGGDLNEGDVIESIPLFRAALGQEVSMAERHMEEVERLKADRERYDRHMQALSMEDAGYNAILSFENRAAEAEAALSAEREKVARLEELVQRAQKRMPITYINWHADARAALEGKL